MMKLLKSWAHTSDGATAIEYGIIVAGVALGISIVVFFMGDQIVSLFETLSASMDE